MNKKICYIHQYFINNYLAEYDIGTLKYVVCLALSLHSSFFVLFSELIKQNRSLIFL
jgi:hypothetical protein